MARLLLPAIAIRVKPFTCTPKVFNREELQYETYEMGVWDYWRGDKGDEIKGLCR